MSDNLVFHRENNAVTRHKMDACLFVCGCVCTKLIRKTILSQYYIGGFMHEEARA